MHKDKKWDECNKKRYEKKKKKRVDELNI